MGQLQERGTEMTQPVPAVQRRVRGQTAVFLLHRLPTRLRLGVPALREPTSLPPGAEREEAIPASSLADTVESAVSNVEGVTSAQANSVTGSLLVEHDGAPGREDAIMSTLYDVLPPAPPLADEPLLLTELRRVGEALNQASLRASKGRIDLRTTLPLLLGIYGLSRLIIARPYRPPSGLTMVWWAYTSMRQLAQESKR